MSKDRAFQPGRGTATEPTRRPGTGSPPTAQKARQQLSRAGGRGGGGHGAQGERAWGGSLWSRWDNQRQRLSLPPTKLTDTLFQYPNVTFWGARSKSWKDTEEQNFSRTGPEAAWRSSSYKEVPAAGGGGAVAKLCPTLRPHGLVACQAPLSMEFSRQEYWSGLPFLPPGDFPKPRTEPGSPVLQADQLSYKGSSQQPQGCWKEKEKAEGMKAEKAAGALGTAGQHLWVRPVPAALTGNAWLQSWTQPQQCISSPVSTEGDPEVQVDLPQAEELKKDES